MKRSDFIRQLEAVLYQSQRFDGHDMESVMRFIESKMVPKQYVHPKAIEEYGDLVFNKGVTWAYLKYIDDYGRAYEKPYEFYVEGWEDE